MYTRCPACSRGLGRNQVLEPFPVGTRVAFDPFKGRLWVLCEACRSWNLVPFLERWEAVEAAERAFAEATVGASTEHVALARAADGTRLIRVGRVERRELAAWRYGERLGSRWRRVWRRGLAWGVCGGVAGLGLGAFFPAIPGVLLPLVMGVPVTASGLHEWFVRPRAPRLPAGGGAGAVSGEWGQYGIRLVEAPDEAEGWRLLVPRPNGEPLALAGGDAMSLLRRILPRVNWWTGTRAQVDNAVNEVVRLGSPERIILASAQELAGPDAFQPYGKPTWALVRARPRHLLAGGHPVLRLALEIAVNEETERRALEGEVRLLEREWREAEALAAISDDLLLPGAIRRRLRELKGRA